MPAWDDDAVFKTEAGGGVTVRRAAVTAAAADAAEAEAAEAAEAAVILHLALGAAGSL